jgi:hypothetical protein
VHHLDLLLCWMLLACMGSSNAVWHMVIVVSIIITYDSDD